MPEIGQNIFKNQIRFDLEIIADLIKPNTRVLDIGCGDGELLQFLVQTKNIDGRGLEISQTQVSKSLLRGLSVIHGNAENDLAIYPNRSFDYAVLSQTLQAMHRPKEVLNEMLRVAEFAIVSLPNFAHFRNRLHLLLKGTMPVNEVIPFEWYETPNIHFCSIRDFQKLCLEAGFRIEKKIFLTAKHRLISSIGANIWAQYAVFLISKEQFLPSGEEEFAFKKNVKIALTPQPGVACLKQVR